MSEHFEIAYLSHFKAIYKKLTPQTQEKIKNTVEQIVSYKKTHSAVYGLRIKQLRHKIFEARVDIATRIVFFSDKNLLRFIALGNHDDIVRALKHIDQINYP